LEEKKVLKLQGILKGYDIDFSDLKKFKKQSWEHLEQEFNDEPHRHQSFSNRGSAEKQKLPV